MAVAPTPQTSQSLTPPPARREPTWEELETRFGYPQFVREAKATGAFTPLEFEDLGRKRAELYGAGEAWDAGLPMNEIHEIALRKIEQRRYGTISEQPERGFVGRNWQGIKNAWQAANPAANPLELEQNPSTLNKLGSAAMMPFRAAGEVGLAELKGIDEGTTYLGGKAAAGLAEAAPGLPAAIPAAVGMVTAEVLNPLNWIGGGATRAGAEAAALAKSAGRNSFQRAGRSLANEAINELPIVAEKIKPLSFINQNFQYMPGNVMQQGKDLAGIARGVGRLGIKGAQALNNLGELARGTKTIEAPSYLQDALATVSNQPKSWQELGRDTRIKDLIEVAGQERALGAEAKVVSERAERREIELMKRNGMSEEDVKATLDARRAAKAAEPTTFAHPWEQAEKTAAELKASPDLELKAQGQALQDTVDASKTGNVDTATVDEVFGIGHQGPVQGLPEESKTFRKFFGKDGQVNTLANSVKYFAGRFLADPTSVLPRMANEAGRVYDKYNRTKFAFYDGVREAFNGLDQTEKMITTLMLDTHQKDWAAIDHLITPKVEAAYMKTKALLNKLADVEGLKRQERIGDYFPHLGLHERQYKNGKGILLPEDGVAAYASPAESWLPRMESDTAGRGLAVKAVEKLAEKSGLGATFDPEHLLAVRINAGLRKAYFNPMMKLWEPRLADMTPGAQAYASAYMNKLLGRPGKVFEAIDKALSNVPWGNRRLGSQDLNRWQLGLTMNYYRGLLGAAFDTAFKNLGQAQNTVAELGFGKTAKGAGRLFVETFLTPESKRVFAQSGVIDDYEHIVAGSAEMLNRGKLWKTMDRILFAPMKFSEYLNRGTAFHAGLAQAYEQGLKGNKALNFAKAMVDKTQFRYGVTNTSPYLQNPFGKLWYQFGSYPLKEVEFINQLLRDPDKRKIYRMLLFHGAVLGGGAAAGVDLKNAMGYTPVTVPFTGDKDTGEKRLQISLPIAILPHLGVYTAPAMRTAASGADAVSELIKQGYPGAKAQALIDNMSNLIPGRRYLGKVAEAYQMLQQGMDTRPPSLAKNTVSLMRGEGIIPYSPGGPKADVYGKADFAKDLLGIRDRSK